MAGTQPDLDEPLLDQLAELALQTAAEAGKLLRESLGEARKSISTKSTPTDMVTEVDRASESLILERLRAARPEDGVLAEEGDATRGRSGIVWLVDPLDGTTNYIYRRSPFAVSLAAATRLSLEETSSGTRYRYRTQVGVVYDPILERRWVAIRGRGAWVGGRRIVRPKGPQLASALVGTGFSYHSVARAAQARILATVLPRVRDIRRAGSAAVDLCEVATGELDAFFEAALNPWDKAAGELVAAEAGAWVGELEPASGAAPTTVAAAPGLAEDLLALLREASADHVPWL